MGDHQLAALASPTAVIAPLPPLQIVQSKLEEEGRKEADGPPRMQLEGPEGGSQCCPGLSMVSGLSSDPVCPVGGLQGWLNVAGAFLVLCATFGYINASFGVFQAYYQESYSERSPSDISWIGSVGMTIEFGMALATVSIVSGSEDRLDGVDLAKVADTFIYRAPSLIECVIHDQERLKSLAGITTSCSPAYYCLTTGLLPPPHDCRDCLSHRDQLRRLCVHQVLADLPRSSRRLRLRNGLPVHALHRELLTFVVVNGRD